MNNPKKNQKGAVVIIVAVMLLTLIGFLGLAVDSGYMFVKKNELQNVADAVALACLIKDRDAACGTAASPTTATPVTNNTDITPVLTPVIPPGIQTNYVVLATNPFTPCPSSATQCAKATASTQFTPFFMRAFGFSNLPISASAVAVNTAGLDCLIVQDLLNQNGTPQLYGKNCDVRMGQAHDVGTTQITAAHNYIYNGNPPSGCSDCSPPAISKAGAVPVPSLVPNVPSWDAAAPLRTDPICKNATCNLLPGRYPLGINCSGSKADCRFATGKYYLDGPLNLDSNNGQSSGTQVFFYMRGNGTNGDISVNAGGVSSLTGFGTSIGTCPLTNYQLLFYAPDGNSGQTFSLRGNTGSSIVGNIYLKDYFLDWRGTNAMTVDGTIVVNKFHQNGTNTLTIDPTKISCHFGGGGRIYLIE